MVRLGLCCIFREQPIRFRNTTATACMKLPRAKSLEKISELCRANAGALMAALEFCAGHGIGCFRINSQILPLKTHPKLGYAMDELPEGNAIVKRFKECKKFAKQHDLRMSFHPDQFVVLNSTRADVVTHSVDELEYQAEVADWVGADVINIHGGGAYGDKEKALADFRRNLSRLSARVRKRLTLENDDKIYTPADLLPICRAEKIPLVYDVHHHRCNPDDLSIDEATELAITTWNREPMFHVSSPMDGWQGPKPHRHHDYINIRDFPKAWDSLAITVEVEAKAKELAVEKLAKALKRRKK